MPFHRPTREQIRRRVQSDFRKEFGNTAAQLDATVERGLVEAIVGISHAAHGRLDQIYRDSFPHLASEAGVKKWAAFYNMFSKPATYAEGFVMFYGQIGVALPTDTVFARSDGVAVRVTAGGVFPFGNLLSLHVKAVVPGSAGNTPFGTTFALQESIEGVQSTAEIIDPAGLGGGAQAETPAELRTRLLELLAQPEGGGVAGDYIRWAKLVPGVTRAWEFKWTPKIGNVTLLFMRDSDESGPFPSEPERVAVAAMLLLKAPIGLPAPIVVIPGEHPLTLSIQLTIEDGAVLADVKAAIVKSIQDMLILRTEPAPANNTVLYRSWISEAISAAAGEKDHKLLVPAADILLAQWKLPTLTTVNVAFS